MGLDLRFPLGALFVAMGVLLCGYGILTRHSPIYGICMGVNLNLGWGAALCSFGALMLVLARKGSK